MNRSLFLAIALLPAAALLSAPATKSAKDLNPKPVGFPAKQVTVSGARFLNRENIIISAGTTEASVLRLLGKPRKVLGPNVVFYDNCAPDQAEAAQCRDLIITYKEGKVASLIFSNALMTELIAFEAQYKGDNQIPGKALAMPNQ